MKILALEFSSPERSAALIDDRVAGSHVVLGFTSERGGRSTRAIALIEEVLRESKCEREEIDCLAIGLGPGSYTGIRAAIALVQGWELARPVKILGLSSVECLARQAQAANLVGEINIVIDAQRNEFYLARYEVAAAACREVEPLRLASAAEVEKRHAAGEILVSSDVTRWQSPQVQSAGPTAVMLGRLAAGKTFFVPAETLAPIYLRETNFVKAPPSRVMPD